MMTRIDNNKYWGGKLYFPSKIILNEENVSRIYSLTKRLKPKLMGTRVQIGEMEKEMGIILSWYDENKKKEEIIFEIESSIHKILEKYKIMEGTSIRYEQ